MFKAAATIRETSPFSLGRILGGTVGRVTSLPIDPLIHQEKFPHTLTNMTEEEAEEAKKELERDYGRAISDTEIQLGGPAMLHNLARVWHNRRAGILSKLLGTAMSPLDDTLSSLLRANYYNPFADAVVTGSNSPEMLQQRLGEAAMINQVGEAAGGGPSSRSGRFLRGTIPAFTHLGPYGSSSVASVFQQLAGFGTAQAAAGLANRKRMRSTIYPGMATVGVSPLTAILGAMAGKSLGGGTGSAIAGGVAGAVIPPLIARLIAGLVNRSDRAAKRKPVFRTNTDHEIVALRQLRKDQERKRDEEEMEALKKHLKHLEKSRARYA